MIFRVHSVQRLQLSKDGHLNYVLLHRLPVKQKFTEQPWHLPVSRVYPSTSSHGWKGCAALVSMLFDLNEHIKRLPSSDYSYLLALEHREILLTVPNQVTTRRQSAGWCACRTSKVIRSGQPHAPAVVKN